MFLLLLLLLMQKLLLLLLLLLMLLLLLLLLFCFYRIIQSIGYARTSPRGSRVGWKQVVIPHFYIQTWLFGFKLGLSGHRGILADHGVEGDECFRLKNLTLAKVCLHRGLWTPRLLLCRTHCRLHPRRPHRSQASGCFIFSNRAAFPWSWFMFVCFTGAERKTVDNGG